MIETDTGFDLRNLLLLFHPLVVCAFALVAIAAVLLLYRRGPQAMALFLALACPCLVVLDFVAFGSPPDDSSAGAYVVAKAIAVFVPLLIIGLAAVIAWQLRASFRVAMASTLILTLLFASPIWSMCLLTVGCLLTGDCL
jgi:phosphoglycerol transferase MdoB-like AlkP superfamily enzyme